MTIKISEQASKTIKQLTMLLEKSVKEDTTEDLLVVYKQLFEAINMLTVASLDSEDTKTLLKMKELHTTFNGKKQPAKQLEAKLEDILQQTSADYEFGETFKIGMYQFEKVQGMGKSSLDDNLLKDWMESHKDLDEDKRATAYSSIYKLPVTQKEIEKVFEDMDIPMTAKNFFTAEPNGKVKIKAKN